MSLSSLIWGQSQFDEAVDKATSELRLAEEDIALNLEICDQIRSKSVNPKDATRALKRRLNHKNPNVQLLALGLADVCVKNGGDHFLTEVASKEFMDNLVSILRIPGLNIDVKNKALRLIQNWSVAFEGKYTLSYVGQIYKELNSEGFHFPPKDMAIANSAMVDTSTAPDWIDSDVCLRCRTAFTFTNRKHHCRNCGQVFDQQCSSKTLPLPHFGIMQEVRVCDGCFAKQNKSTRDKERSHGMDFYSGHRRLSSSRPHKHRIARDSADAELQRVIQLSLADSGITHSHGSSHSHPLQYNQWQSSEPPLVDRGTRPNSYKQEEENDPELKAAIEASLREANAPKPSAPIVTPYAEPEENSYTDTSLYLNGREGVYVPQNQPPLPTLPNHDLNPRESDTILTFSQTVQDVRAQGGSDFSRISNVHEMYDRANSLRPKLALSLDDTSRKEQMLSEMHDKLSHAVKLYDQLLTEQISRPTWRAKSTPQHAYAYTSSQHQKVDGLERPDLLQQYVGSPPPLEQSYRTVGYGSTVAPPVQTQTRPLVQHQSSFASDYGTASSYTQPHLLTRISDSYEQPTPVPPGSTYHNPYLQQPQSWPQTTVGTAQSQPAYPPPTPTHEHRPRSEQYHSQHGAVAPASPFDQQFQPPHTLAIPSAGHQLPHSSLHLQPVQSPVQSLALVPQHQYLPMAAQPIQSPPPPQHKSYYQPTHPSTLSRHNTLSHPPPPAATSSIALGRSNTVGSRPQSQHSYASAAVTPNSLPAFPIAPTSNPQEFLMYSPPATGLEQTEKKEVALIDL